MFHERFKKLNWLNEQLTMFTFCWDIGVFSWIVAATYHIEQVETKEAKNLKLFFKIFIKLIEFYIAIWSTSNVVIS